MCISLDSPIQGGRDRIKQIDPLQPGPTRLVELAALNLHRQVVSQTLCLGVRLPRHPSLDQLLSDTRIPDMMQIKLDPVKLDQNPISSLGNILIVQRLVNITHKMDDELGRDESARLSDIGVQ